MIRESGAGGGLRMNEIKWLLGVVIDVIVQFDRDERGRFISEIYYQPRRQRLGRWDEALPVYRDLSGIRERSLGDDHPDTVAAHADEAHCLERLGQVCYQEP